MKLAIEKFLFNYKIALLILKSHQNLRFRRRHRFLERHLTNIHTRLIQRGVHNSIYIYMIIKYDDEINQVIITYPNNHVKFIYTLFHQSTRVHFNFKIWELRLRLSSFGSISSRINRGIRIVRGCGPYPNVAIGSSSLRWK